MGEAAVFMNDRNYGTRDIRNAEKLWRKWFHENQGDIEYQRGVINDCIAQLPRYTGEENARLAAAVQEMIEEFKENARRAVAIMRQENPLAFFKPSWEQAQVLNAWSPSFEPDQAPEGYRSQCNFTCNRGGKTTGTICVNTLLWLVPNDPEWKMFQWMEDEEGQKHGCDRGRYRVEMRPNWDVWKRTGKLVLPQFGEPPMGPCEVWIGVENDNHWNDKVGKEFLKWAPKSWVGRRQDGGQSIFKQERRIESRFGHSLSGKTYNADTQDWAGKAVRIIAMDEGFPKRIFDEALLRVESGGYFFWAYTAAEARNIGERAKLAYDCYKGKHKLVGQAKFFDNFRMDMIPAQIMAEDKKSDDIARLSQEGELGRVRMGEIPFAATSPTVFSHFDRERNVLPIDGPEVLLAIRGETVTRWVQAFGKMRADTLQYAFHRANIIRGMDEGLANPTACVWTAILRTGEYVSFREWEESGLSVSERCREIIERSGNRVRCLNPEAIEERRRYTEEVDAKMGMKVRRTFADSKMFKRDAMNPQDDWVSNYHRAGLRIERATNIGPAARCDKGNDMLRGDASRKQLMSEEMPGCRAYVTRDCVKLIERFSNYLWQQVASGQRAGEFTDKPEAKDDHLLDAGPGYSWNCELRWNDPTASAQHAPVMRDRQTGAIIR